MSEEIIFVTKQSPRFEDGAWKWYVYNTFSLIFKIKLVDEQGQLIILDPTDTLTFEFHKGFQYITKFVFTNLSRAAGSQTIDCELDFGSEDPVTHKIYSNLFDIGNYTYCVTFNGDQKTTVLAKGKCEVEICH